MNYIHNSQNQLIQIDFYQGTSKIKESRYLYDALGRRVKKQVTDLANPTKSFTRHYIYDGNELLAELDQDNTLLALYTQSTMRTDDTLSVHITYEGASQGLAIASGNYQFIKDGLGSVTEVTNSNGDLLQRMVYSSFGKLLAVKDTLNNDITSNPTLTPYFTFTNREWDSESGLYYFRARFYSPEIGRFITVDPDAGRLDTPISTVNKYLYVINDPINITDPSGASIFDSLGKWGSVLLGGAILGPIGQLAAVNFSGQFSEKDIKIVNTIVILAGIYAYGGFVIASTTAEGVGIAAGSAAIQSSFQDGSFIDNFLVNFGFNLLVNPILAPGVSSSKDIVGDSIYGAGYGSLFGVIDFDPGRAIYNSRESVEIRKKTYLPQGKIK